MFLSNIFGADLMLDPRFHARDLDDVTFEHKQDSLTYTVDVPGCTSNDIAVDVVGQRTLSVTYRRREKELRRLFTVHSDYDIDNIKVSLANGQLTIDLPKIAKAKQRRITISTS